MNVSFTKKQQDYIANQLKSGDYQNASEVVRDALRLHALYRQRIVEELRKEIEIGWNSPVSSKSVKDIIDEMEK
jgi:antitoxin ParD1/3/4